MSKLISISELSKILDFIDPITKKPLNHIIRYWEKEFDQINPLIKSSGIRKFTKENINTISLIYTMLKKDGLTIQGAKKKLKSNDISEVENLIILKKLNKIREDLKSLKNNL